MYTIDTPRVEECIGAVMARHHGTSERAMGKYFEEVHQYLAPLARELERENNLLRLAIRKNAIKPGICDMLEPWAAAVLETPNV